MTEYYPDGKIRVLAKKAKKIIEIIIQYFGWLCISAIIITIALVNIKEIKSNKNLQHQQFIRNTYRHAYYQGAKTVMDCYNHGYRDGNMVWRIHVRFQVDSIEFEQKYIKP